MDWSELAKDHLASAESLLVKRHWRSAVSRCYYATYCAVTWKALLRRPISFSRGYQNPSYEAISGLVRNKCGLDDNEAAKISEACALLRYFRVDADYKPQVDFDQQVATEVFREATYVLSALEVM